jgi:hypothetical protein
MLPLPAVPNVTVVAEKPVFRARFPPAVIDMELPAPVAAVLMLPEAVPTVMSPPIGAAPLPKVVVTEMEPPAPEPVLSTLIASAPPPVTLRLPDLRVTLPPAWLVPVASASRLPAAMFSAPPAVRLTVPPPPLVIAEALTAPTVKFVPASAVMVAARVVMAPTDAEDADWIAPAGNSPLAGVVMSPLVSVPLRVMMIGDTVFGVAVDILISPDPAVPPVVLIAPVVIVVPLVPPATMFTAPLVLVPPPLVTVTVVGKVMTPLAPPLEKAMRLMFPPLVVPVEDSVEMPPAALRVMFPVPAFPEGPVMLTSPPGFVKAAPATIVMLPPAPAALLALMDTAPAAVVVMFLPETMVMPTELIFAAILMLLAEVVVTGSAVRLPLIVRSPPLASIWKLLPDDVPSDTPEEPVASRKTLPVRLVVLLAVRLAASVVSGESGPFPMLPLPDWSETVVALMDLLAVCVILPPPPAIKVTEVASPVAPTFVMLPLRAMLPPEAVEMVVFAT